MYLDSEIDWKAYQEGYDKCIEVDNDKSKAENPYPKESLKWKSWNRGWNAA